MATAAQPGLDDDVLGPVDFLAIELPAGRLTAPGFEKLLSLADQSVVEILDMEFIAKDADGKSKKVDVWEFAVPDGVDLTAWAGASSGLLDEDRRYRRGRQLRARPDSAPAASSVGSAGPDQCGGRACVVTPVCRTGAAAASLRRARPAAAGASRSGAAGRHE